MKLKEIIYALFAVNYRIGTILPVKKKFVFSVMTHDGSPSGNICTLTEFMSKEDSFKFYYMAKEERKTYFHLLFVLPFIMSRAEYILMDNAFMPMSFFKVRKETKVLQLWHGTGSIKKFGQDSNKGRLKELEKRLNSNIDYLFVNSDSLVTEYASAFGIPVSKVFATGLPRTDWLINLVIDKNRLERENEIREKISKAKKMDFTNKKVVLYAPTFRDDEISAPKLHLDVNSLVNSLPSDAVLFLKLHPFVSKAFKEDISSDRIINVSDYNDLNELMAVSDALITDYSSLVFDYIVLDKPMYFFADDIKDFAINGRGFYLDYNKDLPGLLPASEAELGRLITKNIMGFEEDEFKAKRKEFLSKYYNSLDGKSAERVYRLAIKE